MSAALVSSINPQIINENPEADTHEVLTERLKIIEDALEASNALDNEYKVSWADIVELNPDLGIPSNEFDWDPIEVINTRGPIPVKEWLNHVLFGVNGYYSTGRSKINEDSPEGFTTTLKYPQSVYAYAKLLEEYTGEDQADIVSLASGTGFFEKNLQNLIDLGLIKNHFNIKAVDLSSELHSRSEIQTINSNRLKVDHIKASVLDMDVIGDSSMDGVFGNEIQSQLPPDVYFYNNGEYLKPVVNYNNLDKSFHIQYQPINDNDLKLIKMYEDYRRHTGDPEIVNGEHILVGINNIKLTKESARILKPGKGVVYSDYTMPVYDNKNRIAYYNNHIRYQSGQSWNKYFMLNPTGYKAPYADLTMEMDPDFLFYVGECYGLEQGISAPQRQVEQHYHANIPNAPIQPEAMLKNHYRVISLKKVAS